MPFHPAAKLAHCMVVLYHATNSSTVAHQKVKIALRGSFQNLSTSALGGVHSLMVTQFGDLGPLAVKRTYFLCLGSRSQSMQ